MKDPIVIREVSTAEELEQAQEIRVRVLEEEFRTRSTSTQAWRLKAMDRPERITRRTAKPKAL